jgi:hypothetical protein
MLAGVLALFVVRAVRRLMVHVMRHDLRLRLRNGRIHWQRGRQGQAQCQQS